MQGLFEPRHGRISGNDGADVIATKSDFWPSIILSFPSNVEFIAAFGPMFVRPDFSRFWVRNHPLGIAMSPRPNRRARIGFFNKRIVFGDASIGIEPMHFAGRGRQRLRVNIAHAPFAACQVQFSIPTNLHATSIVPMGFLKGLSHK